MVSNTNIVYVVLMSSLVSSVSAFTSLCFSTRKMTTMRMSSQRDDEPSDRSLSFDEAGRALVEEEEAARAELSGTGITEEERLSFEQKRAEYDSMREQIRARASDLNIKKSVATQQAVEEATRRAMAREDSPEVDLSKIGFGGLGTDTEPEDELTEEQMAEIDKVGQMGLWGQIIEEFKGTKFPGVAATIRQTGLMLVIFVITAGYIFFVDRAVRTLYINVGLLPTPGQVFDYSDLELPPGWTDMMTEADL